MADIFKVAVPAGLPRASALVVHGLGGDPYDTWRCGTGNRIQDSDPTFWPLWLARDCEGLAVYVIGYETWVSRWRGSTMHFIDQADNLLARILAEPALAGRPLILIGHSLGGLLIKQLLRTANDTMQSRAGATDLLKHVDKVVFLATPHSGAELATWGDRLRILARPSSATASLVRNDPTLRNLNNWYRSWANPRCIDHLILREDKPTRILGMIVPPDSADPGLAKAHMVPINRTHTGICKPSDANNEIYVLIKDFIGRPKGRSEEVAQAGVIEKNERGSDRADLVDISPGRVAEKNRARDTHGVAGEGDGGAESPPAGVDDIERLLRWGQSKPVSKIKYVLLILIAALAIFALLCWWLWPAEYRVRLDAPENVGYLGPSIDALADKLEEPCGLLHWLPFWPRRCAKIEFEDDAVRTLVVSQSFDMTSRDPLAILLALRQTYQPCFNIIGVEERRLRLYVDEREVSLWKAPDGTDFRLCRAVANARDVLARRHGGQ